MSGTQQPSPVQQAVSPVSGSWAGMAGWQKIGGGVVVVGAVAVLIMMPDLFGGAPAPTPRRADTNTSAPEPFTAPASFSTLSGALGTLPRTGTSQLRAVRRAPPTPIALYESRPTADKVAGATNANAASLEASGERPARGDGSSESGDSLSQQVNGAVSLDTMTASVLERPDYTITADQKIPCLPIEAINSALGGFVSCRVPEWVRSTTQRRGLIPPGSIITGQVRTGLSQGQRRLGVLFTRIRTSGDNMVIRIRAPGADTMGRAGLDGEVETFFWDQVGAVALYALIDGVQQGVGLAAGAAAGAALGGTGGPSLYNFGGGGSGGSLAGTALQGRINRAPELRRAEAQPILVSLGQDLDFYKACRSRMQVNPMACPVQ